MFEVRQTNTMRRSLFSMLKVTYHASVQKVRSSHRNAVWAIMTSILQVGMFVANMVPGFIISMFDWNPLFHIIDQMRGAVFVNYFPHHTNCEYPLYVACGLLIIGLMAEFFTTKRASMSWDMGR